MLKVLIVEDDLMMADMVEEILTQNGYEICGIAPTVAQAVALGRRHKPDLALIDMRLADGGLGTDAAAQLAAFAKIGILYASGNMSQVKKAASVGAACLCKPYRDVDLLRGLEIVAEIEAKGTASPPFPPGFELLAPKPAGCGERLHE